MNKKKIITFIVFTVLLTLILNPGFVQETLDEINNVELYEVDGIYYRSDTNKPYSGLYHKFPPEDGGYFEGTYKDGIKHGPFRWYYELDGQLKSEGTYMNGKLVGPFKTYHENGQLQSEGTFKDDGINHGLTRTYYENGQLQYEVMYKDGEIIDVIKED